MKRDRVTALGIGVVLGVTSGIAIAVPLAAQMGISWAKEQVVPVVIVEPVIGGFAPVEGTKIGNTWRKEEVVPVCLVKPAPMGGVGFVSVQNPLYFYHWDQHEVKPYVEVKPSFGVFVPAQQ